MPTSPEPHSGLPRIPKAPGSIEKGSSLKGVLGPAAIRCLTANIQRVHPEFDGDAFGRSARQGLEPLSLLERGQHLAGALREHLPPVYSSAIDVLLRSLTPPLPQTSGHGLAVFFYLPHVAFVGRFGLDRENNQGRDPFTTSMKAQYELTRRFSAEFSMRPYLIRWPERTLRTLLKWTTDPDPHVRRLCSEGTRPRLPWAPRIPALVKDPRPALGILEALKDDPEIYVRRSVANHLGDIGKDHPELLLGICARWVVGASDQRRWLIRHALRHPAKKGNPEALRLRSLAGAQPRAPSAPRKS